MKRLSIVTFSALLMALVFVFGTTEEHQSGPIPLVKAPEGPIKTRVPSAPMGPSYALDFLAMPYIKDKVLMSLISKRWYCGTSAVEYLYRHPEPSEEFLRNRAAIIEARLREEFYTE